ncbi:MAG: hypothetical protein A2Y23_14530 [Clostridiales bacterium GWB2_37_7]|nr:MAG: hypothetical protein A2Y23_14530 [Clostridiales bacterium GWB2_37_7]
MNFVHTPNLPINKIKTALVDYRIGAEAEATLVDMGIEVIKTVPCEEFYEAIKGHPDIVVHHVGDNNLVVAPNVFDKLEPVLAKKGFALTKGETWLNRNYPENVAYNVLRVGSIAFHNTKYTDQTILREFEKNKINLIHVNQGYTKCSTCIVDEHSIITSDYKLAMTAMKYGVDCLLIKPGGIILSGLDYGFIGGSGGLLSKNTMAFTGNLDNIQDNYKIYDYLKGKGIEVKILSRKQIFDIGSIIPLTY